jgi:hypothetical protein
MRFLSIFKLKKGVFTVRIIKRLLMFILQIRGKVKPKIIKKDEFC